MSVEKLGGKAVGGRVKSRWQLDFSSKSGHSHNMELVSPPGYSAGQCNHKAIFNDIP